MTITQTALIRILSHLILGEDYRTEVVALINTAFLDYAIEFFKRIAEAKLRDQNIDMDWYRREMLADTLDKADIATHAGLNMKTIQNIYGNTRKNTVIEVSEAHYDTLIELLEELVKNQNEIDLMLTIKFRGIAIDLNISESLLVINALAVKRAALRGGVWSAIGKQVEKLLMKALCRLHKVPPQYYDQSRATGEYERDIDFFLFDKHGEPYPCEIKLMGRGNPESADATFARSTKIFIADTLLDSVKTRLDSQGILWVELKNSENLVQFQKVLNRLGIPYEKPVSLEAETEAVLKSLQQEVEVSELESVIREEHEHYNA